MPSFIGVWTTKQVVYAGLGVLNLVALILILRALHQGPSSSRPPQLSPDAYQGGETEQYLVYDSRECDGPPQCRDPASLQAPITALLASAGCTPVEWSPGWKFSCPHGRELTTISLFPRASSDNIRQITIAMQWRGSILALHKDVLRSEVPDLLKQCHFDVKRLVPVDQAPDLTIYSYPEDYRKMAPEYCKDSRRFLLEADRAARDMKCDVSQDRGDQSVTVECGYSLGDTCVARLFGTAWVSGNPYQQGFVIRYQGAASEACNDSWFARKSTERPDFGMGAPGFLAELAERCGHEEVDAEAKESVDAGKLDIPVSEGGVGDDVTDASAEYAPGGHETMNVNSERVARIVRALTDETPHPPGLYFGSEMPSFDSHVLNMQNDAAKLVEVARGRAMTSCVLLAVDTVFRINDDVISLRQVARVRNIPEAQVEPDLVEYESGVRGALLSAQACP